MSGVSEAPGDWSRLRATIPQSVQLQELDGEAIILNLDSELYLGLNKTGYQILKLLSEHASIEEAYEALLSQYDIEAEQLRSELSEFLETLKGQGLVELTST